MTRYHIIHSTDLNDKSTSGFVRGLFFENSFWKLTLKASGTGFKDGFVILELRYLTGLEVFNEKIYIQFKSYRSEIIEIQNTENCSKTHLISELQKQDDNFNSTSEDPFGCRVVVCFRERPSAKVSSTNLQTLCETNLVKSVKPENALKLFEHALIFKQFILEEQCLIMILMHYKELKKTSDYIGLRPLTKARIEQVYQETFLTKDEEKTPKNNVRDLFLHCKLR